VVVTAPLKVVNPVPAVCMIDPAETPAFAETLFAEEIVKEARGVMLPTEEESVIDPVPAARVRL